MKVWVLTEAGGDLPYGVAATWELAWSLLVGIIADQPAKIGLVTEHQMEDPEDNYFTVEVWHPGETEAHTFRFDRLELME